MGKRIVIVGSMSFYREMQNVKQLLEAAGWSVFAPGDEAKGKAPPTEAEKATRKVQYDVFKLFHEEIEGSDAVLCYNASKNDIEGYIGANALMELGFGAALKKRLYLMYPPPDMAFHRDEIVAMQPNVLYGNLNNLDFYM
jgi:nucleoside 2-deoxyribosyltransferase